MVTEEDIRRVALSLPGSVEKPYNRLPSFRVRGALFLRLHELPDAFYPAVLVRLSQVDLGEMTELVTESWRLCAPKRMLAAYDAEHPPAP